MSFQRSREDNNNNKELIKAVMEKKIYVSDNFLTSEFASSCGVLLNVQEPVGSQTCSESKYGEK